jgi:hypothetical protein
VTDEEGNNAFRLLGSHGDLRDRVIRCVALLRCVASGG